MIDGEGVPCPVGRQCDYQEAMELLYGITYAIKFWSKRHAIPSGYDTFTMAPVETLWWTKNGEDFGATSPDQWQWTAMLRIPSFVTETFFTEVKEYCLRSKKADSYLMVRRAQMREGKCVQALHVGPYRNEAATIEKLRAYVQQEGYDLSGKHHEIYFNDPRRTDPSKLRTIIRYPVTLAARSEET